MAIQPITIKAVTDAAITQLMITNGLWVLRDGAPDKAPGVLNSHIGDAELESTGVKLAGRFAFVATEDSIFGVAATQAVIAALGQAVYTGPTIRAILGVAPVDPNPGRPTTALGGAQYDKIRAINDECKLRIFAVWPIEKQNTAIIGKLGSVPGYGDAGFAEMETWVDSHVDASNIAQDAILAATTIAQVEAVTVTWPVI